ncbi:hypothetical protein Lal_00019240 [Lupinus albus]|nr:hypothetical protein Lal_00019240 [Lupinus albus]
MEYINIVLNNSFQFSKSISLGLSIPMSKSEHPTSTDNWHLSDGGSHRVPSNNADSATIVLPLGENEVQHHEETKLSLRSRSIDTLCSSHFFGAPLRLLRQGIVHHHHRPEPRRGSGGGWRRCNSDCGLVPAADDVVKIEVEVAKFLLVES